MTVCLYVSLIVDAVTVALDLHHSCLDAGSDGLSVAKGHERTCALSTRSKPQGVLAASTALLIQLQLRMFLRRGTCFRTGFCQCHTISVVQPGLESLILRLARDQRRSFKWKVALLSGSIDPKSGSSA